MTRCEKCQAENEDSAQHCAKCGASLTSAAAQPTTNDAPAAEVQHTAPAAPAVMPPVESNPNTTNPAGDSATPQTKMPNFFGFIMSALTKPISTFRDELSKFSGFASMAVLALIASVVAMLFTLLSSMVIAVVEKHCGFFSGCTTELNFENLGELDYLNLTLVNWLSYLVVIAFVAAIFFGLSRAFKQNQTNFCRIASIVSISIIPMAIGSLVGALISQLNVTVGSIIMMICTIYGLLIFYEGVNDEVSLTGNKKIYYNFLSVLAILVVVCVLWLILAQTSGGEMTRSLLNMSGSF